MSFSEFKSHEKVSTHTMVSLLSSLRPSLSLSLSLSRKSFFGGEINVGFVGQYLGKDYVRTCRYSHVFVLANVSANSERKARQERTREAIKIYLRILPNTRTGLGFVNAMEKDKGKRRDGEETETGV